MTLFNKVKEMVRQHVEGECNDRKHCFTIVRLPQRLSGNEYGCDAGDVGSGPGLERSPGGRQGNPPPVFLPGESHGQGSLAGSTL